MSEAGSRLDFFVDETIAAEAAPTVLYRIVGAASAAIRYGSLWNCRSGFSRDDLHRPRRVQTYL